MDRKPRAKRSQSRKDSIIRAALHCFNEFGYSETTMSMIRKYAGASTGSIYHHFENKDQLAAAVYLEGILDYQKSYLCELAKHQTARAGVFAIVRHHIQWIHRNPEWARYLNRMRHARFMARMEDQFQQANRSFMESVGQWFGKHIVSGKVKKLPRPIFNSVLMGPLQEYTRIKLAGHSDMDADQTIHYLGEIIWSNLQA